MYELDYDKTCEYEHDCMIYACIVYDMHTDDRPCYQGGYVCWQPVYRQQLHSQCLKMLWRIGRCMMQNGQIFLSYILKRVGKFAKQKFKIIEPFFNCFPHFLENVIMYSSYSVITLQKDRMVMIIAPELLAKRPFIHRSTNLSLLQFRRQRSLHPYFCPAF